MLLSPYPLVAMAAGAGLTALLNRGFPGVRGLAFGAFIGLTCYLFSVLAERALREVLSTATGEPGPASCAPSVFSLAGLSGFVVGQAIGRPALPRRAVPPPDPRGGLGVALGVSAALAVRRRPPDHRLRAPQAPSRGLHRASEGGRVRREGARAGADDPAAAPSPRHGRGTGVRGRRAMRSGAPRGGRLLRRLPPRGRQARAGRRGRGGKGDGRGAHHGDREGRRTAPRHVGRRRGDARRAEREAPAGARAAGVRRPRLRRLRRRVGRARASRTRAFPTRTCSAPGAAPRALSCPGTADARSG